MPRSSASASSCWAVARLQRTPSRTPSSPCTVIGVRCTTPRPLLLVREYQESPEDTTVGRHESESLVTAMRTLARRQRQVLACRYVLELTVAETAQLLKISEGSVKAHTHRGLRSLQQRIEVSR